jgi:hypothetical protein
MIKSKIEGSVSSDLRGSVWSDRVGSVSSGQVGSIWTEFPHKDARQRCYQLNTK